MKETPIVIHDDIISENIMHSHVQLTLLKCTFQDSVDDGFGGSLDVSYCTVFINDSVFCGNTASTAGAIYSTNTNISIEDSNFTHNHADGDAGAIYSFDDVLTLHNVLFHLNEADYCAALYLKSSAVQITYTTFVFNEAETYISGMFSYESDGLISYCLFGNNSCENELLDLNGCIFIPKGAPTHLNFTDCTFLYNSVGEDEHPGFDVYVLDSVNVSVSHCTFSWSKNHSVYGIEPLNSTFEVAHSELMTKYNAMFDPFIRKRIHLAGQVNFKFIGVTFIGVFVLSVIFAILLS